jgi:hypothetical protein
MKKIALLCIALVAALFAVPSAMADCKTLDVSEGQYVKLTASPNIPDDYDYTWDDYSVGLFDGTEEYTSVVDFHAPTYVEGGTNQYQIDLTVQSIRMAGETRTFVDACVDYDCIIITVKPVVCPLFDAYICEPYYDTAEPEGYPVKAAEGPVVYTYTGHDDASLTFVWTVGSCDPIVQDGGPAPVGDAKTITVLKSCLNMPDASNPEACTTVTLGIYQNYGTENQKTILDPAVCTAEICLYQYPDAQIGISLA